MKTYLYFHLGLFALSGLMKIFHLAKGKYPRIDKPTESGQDVFGLLIYLALVYWTLTILRAV